MKKAFALISLVTLGTCGGCGSYEPAMPANNPQAAPSNTPATPTTTATGTAPATENNGDEAQQPLPPTPPANQQTQTAAQPAIAAPANQTTAPPAEQPERVRAEVGVGRRGQGYGGGIITEPIRARFRIEDKLRFDQIQQAMSLYKATNERYPKTHAEFMKEIVQANNIPLPELPPGERYVYDPKTAELMVERPAPATSQPQ